MPSRRRTTTPPARPALALLTAALLAAFVSPGCSSPPPDQPSEMDRLADLVLRRAETDRIEELERQVERLRADLRHAEESLVTAESGLRGSQTRADAVTALADARIQVRRGADAATWRRAEIGEAQAKLEEADAQIADEHFGAAVFFVYRAAAPARG